MCMEMYRRWALVRGKCTSRCGAKPNIREARMYEVTEVPSYFITEDYRGPEGLDHYIPPPQQGCQDEASSHGWSGAACL